MTFDRKVGNVRVLNDYPGAAAFAEHNVLEPPSEAEMLERFAKAEIA